MKKFLLLISIAGFFTACKSEREKMSETQKEMAPVDNSKLYTASALTDVGTLENEMDEAAYTAPVRKKVAPKATQRKAVRRSSSSVPEPVYQPAPNAPVANAPVDNGQGTVAQSPTASPAPTSSEGSNNAPGNGEKTMEAPEVKKKGWSDAAKGATIGAVGGAAAGAIINKKNRGVGAIIGGVVGAAGGYVIGRKRDKQSNRTEYTLK